MYVFHINQLLHNMWQKNVYFIVIFISQNSACNLFQIFFFFWGGGITCGSICCTRVTNDNGLYIVTLRRLSITIGGRTAPLTSKGCILYIYSTNIGNEYFKSGIYSPFFSLQNAVCFIILTYLVPVLFTFYTQGVLKLKKNSGAKRLNGNKKKR